MLLLFDIDGTLVRMASSEHALALRQALANVHGVDAEQLRLPGTMAGRTDGEIARLMLLDAGVSAVRIDERAVDVRHECCRLYAALCPPDLRARVTAGIPELLAWLGGLDGVRLALVTGNFEPVARIKLHAAGIGHRFERGQGGFGSDAEDRAMLPPIARRRAGEAAGMASSWPRERTLVIGDTPRDVACARADGVRCVAVTSGPHGPEELGEADGLARSSDELRAILESLLD